MVRHHQVSTFDGSGSWMMMGKKSRESPFSYDRVRVSLPVHPTRNQAAYRTCDVSKISSKYQLMYAGIVFNTKLAANWQCWHKVVPDKASYTWLERSETNLYYTVSTYT